MDWITIKGIADYLINALAAMRKNTEVRREEWKMAVGNLQTAVLETLVYASSLEHGGVPDHKSEVHLVSLWRVAANDFYGIDGELASRLQLKAEYWADPRSWSSSEVIDAGIALDHVAAFTRQLLYESH